MSGPNPNAWNNWYHCLGGTYGTWLPGDPRGFRTWREVEHVEGDYRNPPPDGVYAPLFRAMTQGLKYPPVMLTPEQRRVICDAKAARLCALGIELIALAVAVNHFHLLARFPLLTEGQLAKLPRTLLEDGRDPSPRHHLGLARKHAGHVLRERGLKPRSPVWAKHPKCEPVRDRAHQINVAQYIRNHTREGAAVWWWKDHG